jgi:hypothetical protein
MGGLPRQVCTFPEVSEHLLSCRYYLLGYCAAGDSCDYLHVKKAREHPRANSAAQPPHRPPAVGYAVHSKHALREAQQHGWAASHKCLGDEEVDLTYSTETFDLESMSIHGQHIPAGMGSSTDTLLSQASYAAQTQKGLDGQDATGHVMVQHGTETCPFISEDELARRARIRQQIASSKDMECGICLERVMSKRNEFGLLEGCGHVYCLACIREWRSVTDLEKQVKRSCPLCREVSHMVIPSSYVPDCEESKQQVVTSYRSRLAHIPCKHFRNGEGECPFGTSCMYLHQYRDGTLQRHEGPRLRMVCFPITHTRLLKCMHSTVKTCTLECTDPTARFCIYLSFWLHSPKMWLM